MIETILQIVGTLGGVTGIASLFYIKQNRISKELENESKQSDEWRKLYEEERQALKKFREERDEKMAKKDAEINELFSEITNQRNQKMELHDRIAEMTVELTKLRLLKCEAVNCINRKPPTGY